jgi:D-lactate dehydratase
LKPGDIKWEDYGLFFASAGHASLIDYPDAKGLQSIASNSYAAGGIISAVCHGGAIFPGIIDKQTGKSIIAGKKVTGFTTKGEEEEGVLDTIKSWHRPTIEAAAASAGATCKASFWFCRGPRVNMLRRCLISWTLGCFCFCRWPDRDGR